MPPGTVPVPRTDAAHIGLLSQSIGEEYEHALFLTKFTADVIRNRKGEMMPPTSPIVRLTDFNGPVGQDNMIVPVMKNLVGPPFYGDRIMTGFGEKQRWDYIKVLINDCGFPLEGPGFMSNQRVKALKLATRSRRQLGVRLAQQDEIEAVSASYEGWSRNITDTAANFSYAVTKRYHPNFFVAGSGPVTWSGTAATHITNLHNALDPMSDTQSRHFNVDNLEALRAYVMSIPLDPIVVDGKPFYILLAHHNQIAQLRKDSKFRSEASNGMLRGLSNPIYASAELYASNFLIYERLFSVWGVSSTASALTFGATNPVSALDTYPRKVAVVFGNGFLSKGMAGGVRFDSQKQNIGGYEEYAIRQAMGYARNTWYDVDAAQSTPTTAKDQGSVNFATFSPQPY